MSDKLLKSLHNITHLAAQAAYNIQADDSNDYTSFEAQAKAVEEQMEELSEAIDE